MKENRYEWVDVAKGIGIILVVLGHTSIPPYISNIIWAFHMPLFFIASGVTTNWGKYTFSDFVVRKSHTLIIPFVVYSVFVIWISHQISYEYGQLGGVLRKGWMGYALWFIPVLFLASIIAKVIMSIQNIYIKDIVWIVCVILGATLCYMQVKLPWTLCTVPYAAFLIILGSKLKARIIESTELPKWYMILAGASITLIVSHFWRLDMAWNKITPVTVLTAGALAGTLMTFVLSSLLTRYNVISKLFQAIGRETYIILAFAQITGLALEYYFSWNSIVKYAAMFLILFIVVCLKNSFNKTLGYKIL